MKFVIGEWRIQECRGNLIIIFREEVRHLVLDGTRPNLSNETCSLALNSQIENCWKHNSGDRPGTGDIINMLDAFEINKQSWVKDNLDILSANSLHTVALASSKSIPKNTSPYQNKGTPQKRKCSNFRDSSKLVKIICIASTILIISGVGVAIATLLLSKSDSATVSNATTTITTTTAADAVPPPANCIVSTFVGASALGLNARVFKPLGITFRPLDNMTFFTDLSSGFIGAVKSSGNVSILVQGSPNVTVDGSVALATSQNSNGITIGENCTIYVTDRTSLVRKIQNGFVTTIAGNATANLNIVDGIGAMAVFDNLNHITYDDNSGKFYTCEEGGRIRRVDKSGTVVTLAGSLSPGINVGLGSNARFRNPRGIVFDKSSNLIYISDSINNCIKKMDLTGNVYNLAGATNRATGLADGIGSLARFSTPSGLALDGTGNLIIADMSNHAIRSLNLTSLEVTTIAGRGTPGAKNGNGSVATFNQPRAITFDQDGAILVADSLNGAIRKITLLSQ